MLAPASFSARTVFITGAGTGIGRGFALRAAELGARVALAGRRENLLQETARAIEANVGQWLNKGVFTLPEPGKRYAKV
jgi:NAD(P)-dependent dehydrogenase (short-subunit alcohol dehydrogenase family)